LTQPEYRQLLSRAGAEAAEIGVPLLVTKALRDDADL
jgi:hypothetical protein